MTKQFDNLYAQDRHLLHEVVPLDTPYSINIEPTSFCNMRCIYCLHSLPHSDIIKTGYNNNYAGGYMSDNTYNRLLEQLQEFPQKIASVTFGGVGEPLLHHKLPNMIRALRDANVTKRINVITNGVALTHQLSQDLINAGLSSIKISLQGMDPESYKKVSSYNIDFNLFLDELAFLYQNKGACTIGIKIPDISLYAPESSAQERAQQEEKYQQLFKDKCDKLGIERIVPCFSAVDYSKIEGLSGHSSRYQIPEREVAVCSQIFYRMNIMQNGCVTLCTMLGLHKPEMSIFQNTLKNIWNSTTRKQLLLKQLHSTYDSELELCKNCNVKYDFAYDEDCLDDYREEIITRILNSK